MNEDVLVSVWCLTFNHEKYIRDCLEGFISQKTTFKYEVIIHDDASSDKTVSIIQEYAVKFPNIIKPILQKENQYSKGINILEEYVFPCLRGKYIACCEGDDYWIDEYKLQKQVDFLEKEKGYVACVHQSKRINCVDGTIDLVSPLNNEGIIDTKLILSGGGAAYQTSSLFYRRELMNNRPRFCLISSKVWDYPFSIYLALQGKVYFMNMTSSVYRLFSEGSWSLENKNKDTNISFYQDMIDVLEEANKYSGFKYQDVFEKQLMDFYYKLWKKQGGFEIFYNRVFHKLNVSKQIRLLRKVIERRLISFCENLF